VTTAIIDPASADVDTGETLGAETGAGADAGVETGSPDFDPRELRDALGQFATGVVVITTVTPEGEFVGVTANSFTSVSLDPPLVLWCPGRHLRSLPHFERAERFAINVLASEQHELSRRFATPDGDKFSGVPVRVGLGGVPVLEGTLATFECRTTALHEAGDHVIHLGHVERFRHDPAKPLVFHGGRYHEAARHDAG
jgi:flavin reductase (DIM6/NTAB) family NADH-FMN oxidoreductase RutF